MLATNCQQCQQFVFFSRDATVLYEKENSHVWTVSGIRMIGDETFYGLSVVQFLWNLDRKNSPIWKIYDKSGANCQPEKKGASLESAKKDLSLHM